MSFTSNSDSVTAQLNTIPMKAGTLSWIKNPDGDATPYNIMEYEENPAFFDDGAYLTTCMTPTLEYTSPVTP